MLTAARDCKQAGPSPSESQASNTRAHELLTVLFCFSFLLGCSRTPPGQQRVAANTPLNFAMWRSENSDALTPKEWSLFDLALDELKLKIMLEGKATGSTAVDQAMRDMIDGMPLREVLFSGLQIRLKRISADKNILEDSLTANSGLKLRPGQEEKAQALAAKIRAQSDRLDKLRATVAEAETDLRALELKFK